MEIVHEGNETRGAFAAGEGSDRAEMTYSPGGTGTVVFDHTYVPDRLRGQGLAEKLVEAGVAYAREQQLRVVPACSYVRSLFERHPERYRDVSADAPSREG